MLEYHGSTRSGDAIGKQVNSHPARARKSRALCTSVDGRAYDASSTTYTAIIG